jgi:hypothetical protein
MAPAPRAAAAALVALLLSPALAAASSAAAEPRPNTIAAAPAAPRLVAPAAVPLPAAAIDASALLAGAANKTSEPASPTPPKFAQAAPAPAGKPPNSVACSVDKKNRDPGCLWCSSSNNNLCIACRGGAYWTAPVDNSCGCSPGYGTFVSTAVVNPPVTWPRGGCVVGSPNLAQRCWCRACPGGTFSEGGSLTGAICTM